MTYCIDGKGGIVSKFYLLSRYKIAEQPTTLFGAVQIVSGQAMYQRNKAYEVSTLPPTMLDREIDIASQHKEKLVLCTAKRILVGNEVLVMFMYASLPFVLQCEHWQTNSFF